MTTPVDWAHVEITVRHATPITPCRSGRHGFHTSDCEDVDMLNRQLAKLHAAVSRKRSQAIPATFTGAPKDAELPEIARARQSLQRATEASAEIHAVAERLHAIRRR